MRRDASQAKPIPIAAAMTATTTASGMETAKAIAAANEPREAPARDAALPASDSIGSRSVHSGE
ncbi:hypothetical protein [Microbacterium tenebrionis]|uniref:hypothetical protein n=1 Tax=Microbacterium tenebrionis TaxID=2830665 RepID=UPI00158E2384|nr:hypothetical protein [Microbacterium ihumii]